VQPSIRLLYFARLHVLRFFCILSSNKGFSLLDFLLPRLQLVEPRLHPVAVAPVAGLISIDSVQLVLSWNGCRHQLVAANKGNILIAKPKQVMTKQEALVHAAWIVALADDKDEFERILEDVMAM
jgi:hypothetical protein